MTPAGIAEPKRVCSAAPPTPVKRQFLTDWDEYVRPELRHLFLSARKTVEADLEKLSDRPGRLGRLVVPRAHGDAWLNTLNQARLILASKFNFSRRGTVDA